MVNDLELVWIVVCKLVERELCSLRKEERLGCCGREGDGVCERSDRVRDEDEKLFFMING